MKKTVRVFAPATVANVACGFDIFGFALEAPGDEVHATLSEIPGVRITEITGDGGLLPRQIEKNTAGVSVLKLLEHLNSDQGIELAIHKKMPLASGLGSSAASTVASVFAANELLGRPLSREALLPFAMEGERIACGTAHADNVAPSLLGGFVLVRSYNPLDVIRVPIRCELYCTVLHPHLKINTGEARDLLKKEITLSQHTIQSGNVAGLVIGCMEGDYDLIQRSLQDVIAEPVRAALIPGFAAIKQAALDAEALGCSISGSGPSIFALTTTRASATRIAAVMTDACQQHNITSDFYISAINQTGVQVIS